MRTFKQKPRATQQATSAKSTILRRPHFIGSRNELKAAESYPPVQFFETPESRPSPFTEGLPEAEHTFEGDRYVRPLNDDNFDNIFYNRDKVIVVQFWNAYCRGPCGRIAHRISAVAEQYRTGPYTDLVRFYHVQLDESADTGEIPNPRLSTRFGFESVPVTYFYYTSTGRVPTNGAPLLEASIGGVVPTSDITWRIEHILQRHGHQRERPPVQAMRMHNCTGSPSGVAGKNVTPMQSPTLRSAFKNNDNKGFFSLTGVSGPPLIEQTRECRGSGHLNQQETNIAGVEHKTVSRHISKNNTRIIQREEAGGTLSFPNAHRNVLMIHQNNPGNQIREVMRRLWQLSRPNAIHATEAAVSILWDPHTRQPRFYSYALGTEGQPNMVQICCPPQYEMQGASIVGTIHTHPFPPSLAQQEPSGEDIQAVSQLPVTSGRMENYIVGLEDIFVLFRDGRWFRIGRREQMLSP